jgi:hypothetical protein
MRPACMWRITYADVVAPSSHGSCATPAAKHQFAAHGSAGAAMMQMTGRDMPLREVLIVLITCLLPPLGVFLKQARYHTMV